MSRRELLEGMTVYGLTGVLRQAVGLFLLPMYTRKLDQSAYGGMDLVLAAVALVSLLLNLQLNAGATRYFHVCREKGMSGEFLGGMLGLRVWTGAAPTAILLAFAAVGLGYRPPGVTNLTLWILAVAGVPFALLVELLFLYLRLLEWKWTYALLSLGGAALGGIIAVVLVVWLKWGAAGVIVAMLLSNVVPCVVIVVMLRGSLHFRWVPPQVRDVFSYGLPMVPGMLIAWCWVYLSRFVLVMKLPMTDVAIFALAMKVLIFMALVATAYRMAWEPLSMKVHSERGHDAKSWYVSSFRVQSAGLLLVTALLSAFSRPLIALLAPPSYAKAADLVPFLAVSSLQGSMTLSLNIGNQIAYKTWYYSAATLAGVLVTGAAIWFGIERGGLIAAAIAMVAGSTVTTVLVFLSSQQQYRIPYSGKSLLVFSMGIAGILLFHALHLAGGISPLASETAAILFGGGASWLILGKEDRALVWKLRTAWAGSRA